LRETGDTVRAEPPHAAVSDPAVAGRILGIIAAEL
jgi:hypothetical protein